IKFAIIILILGVLHSVFWFFKTGQTEKKISNLIAENSSYVSAASVSVSGFPLTQKVSIKDLKFTIPNPAFSKYQITIKNLEATSGIFNSNFKVTALEQVSTQDNDKKDVLGYVEFSKEPEINLVFAKGMIVKFSYLDSGHRVLDGGKNVLYASSNTNINLETTLEEGDKIKTKITANIKDIEGFDVLSLYKNSSEKKVIDGIKNGEITIGNSANLTNNLPIAAPQSATTAAAPVNTTNVQAAPTATAANAATVTNSTVANSDKVEQPNSKPEDISAALSGNLVKSNLVADAEYILTPNQSEANQNDPTQVQEVPVQYSKITKINSFEFSNPLYKISVNGQLNIFQDDAMPSGSITVKVEKIDNLINHVAVGLNQIAEQKNTVETEMVKTADLTTNNAAAATAPQEPKADAVKPVEISAAPANNINTTDDAYKTFLKRFSTSLMPVTKELAAKNQLSKDDVAVFDVRREKNIEFLINETPMREILGKF
ncbi:MAG: hypothetical protein SFV53_07100, partial [Rickettsiales bacterium]|nr:hypothetical protein [Rickettsiales bacterium]